jgi:hypothetical protein
VWGSAVALRTTWATGVWYYGIMSISTRAPVIAGKAWMDATGGSMNVMWIHVPAASSADDLATVIDRYPPGAEARYYLLHMALCEGRVDALVDAWEQRSYEVQIAETLLRYTFGTQQAYFAVFWVAYERAPGRPTTPVLHLLPDDSELTLDQLLSEPVSDSVPIDEYRQYRQRNRS